MQVITTPQLKSFSTHRPASGGTPTPPPSGGSDAVQEAIDKLPVLSKVALATGNGLAKLGGGGCALAGGALGYALTHTPIASGMGLGPALVFAGFGYLEGWDAAGAQQAWNNGPTSDEWQRRVGNPGRPPRSLTTAGAGAHFLTAAAFIAGTAAGAAAFGTSGPAGLITGVGTAMVSAVVMGRAAGTAERNLLWAKYPNEAQAMGWYPPT